MNPERFDDRLSAVRERIARACECASRDPDDVEILPVTKGHPAAAVRIAAAAGCHRVGENRVGEAEAKQASLGGRADVAWHLIGHLQRNKADRAARLFDEVESVDSHRLARRLGRIVEEAGSALDVLVQVNASGEDAKGGFPVAEAVDAVREIVGLAGLRVIGLMTMAPYTDDEDVLRRTFRVTRDAFERCRDQVSGFEAEVLSMGMSNDFELAVEEGSTRVRLGTALFGERMT